MFSIYEALQDTVYILVPPRCKKYCTTFCICWTPTLRLKMTATDKAFRWCRLSVLFSSFSQRKWGVCPKKVGKMAFIGCSEFQWTKFAWKLLIELKRYQSKVKVFWNAWAVGFQMVKLKNLSCTKIIVHGRTLLKSVSAVGFTEKPSFLESVSFHGEMFCVTNFWLVLVICIVIAMIFIKKKFINLFRISFYNLLKIIHMINLAMLEKLCLVFFLQTRKN